MSRTLALTLAMALPAAALAADPLFTRIEEKDGKLTATFATTVAKVVPETITVNENGKPVTRTRQRVVMETVMQSRTLDAGAGDFYTPAGERIDPKKLGDVLKKGAILVVSTDGKPIDPEVVKKNKDAVAVLVPKGPAAAKADAPKTELTDEKPLVTEVGVKDGSVVISRDMLVYQETPRQETRVLPGGKAENVTVQVKVPITRKETITLDPKRTQVLRLDGKEIPPADWADVLKDKTKVILSPGGKAIPDELRAANKDAVAVVVYKAK
jgi:hypothetical protein